MQPKEKSCHGVKVPPFFFVVGGEGGFNFSICFGVESGLSVHCSHSTWTVDSRLSMPVSFWGGGRGAAEVFTAKSSQCRPPFTYVGGPKGMITILQNRTSIWGASVDYFF
jgi:hypothetical protein